MVRRAARLGRPQPRLCCRCARPDRGRRRRALNLAGVGLEGISGIVAVSTTGAATPSLDALLIERLHLPPNVQRLTIFGLGCAGGALGLARAATLSASIKRCW